MIELKVGQVWTIKDNNEDVLIVSVSEDRVNVSDFLGHVWDVLHKELKEDFTFNKEETIKYLKEQQEQINKDLEELNKPEIVKHKFEVIVYAPESFDSNHIFKSIKCTVYNYWTDGDITNYSVDVIKE
jgi:hypothetical protein